MEIKCRCIAKDPLNIIETINSKKVSQINLFYIMEFIINHNIFIYM